MFLKSSLPLLKKKLLFLCLLVSSSVISQTTVSGTITDSATKQPLAFASVVFNDNNTTGVTADIDGKFTYTSAKPLTKLTCSYVGYKTQTLILNGNPLNLNIRLEFSSNELKEVVISGENPANAIMRKVIANKDINDPENIPSFTCRTYNKVVFDMKFKKAEDSLKLKQKLNGHLFMMESVSERKFIAPDISEEKVIATKASGLKDPHFASLATDLQPFSFYKDNITFFNVNYLNPVTKGSLNKYKFAIQDTLYTNNDTVYVLSYKPLPKKNFEGLTGLLYINTHKYAVQNVTASPYEKGKIDIKIQQQYGLKDGYWFPEQLNYVLSFAESPNKALGIMVAEGKSYIDDVVINPPLRKRDFPLQAVHMDDNAGKKDSLYWAGVRKDPLTIYEQNTYKYIDSLGQKYNFDRLMTLSEKLATGRIPWGFIDVDITKAFIFNRYEGWRPGLGLYTNDKLIKNVSIGGYAGYGLEDHDWKYSGEAVFTVSKKHEFVFRGKYQDNLIETGKHGYKFPVPNAYNTRALLGYQYDRVQEARAEVGFRALRYTKWNIGLTTGRTTPMYNYAFTHNGKTYIQYNNTELGVNLKFAFKERIVGGFGQNISMGTVYPVLFLHYARGLKGAFDGNFEYNKIEAAVEQSFLIKNVGRTTYRLEGGYIDRALPYGMLFTGEGSYDTKYPLIIRRTFQTVRPYEFLSDRYVNLFTSHNFGGLLFKTDWFQPQLVLHNNFGWGNLKHTEGHSFINYKTKDKFFSETGLQVDNILKFNYLNIGYLGLGAGVFYRYGGYAYSDAADNAIFKVTMSFSIK
ncbi:hypothetical protein GR160_17530 [Flavobacterium sp. Sd200]|uniref:DUF5686 and carboxypeptidase-like regulatory domain-containing protein n=1 Tax=Flavobacterium sp. Sd200 TaxID=2692211 RepID=UPI00136FA3AB|nr:DUF5686 and carboxypeptidase-like regulatory domain-containing protein [Flavobacterium sp. Sd200]MXN93031.1 hypothetical protein [Flavobacterium sp. Sd200]